MTARDLISSKFVRIGESHSIAEAVGIIFDPDASALREIVIVVLAGDGGYLGLVEPRDILESLGAEISAAGENPAAQVSAIRRGLRNPVAEFARRDVPAVRLDDNLATLLLAASKTQSITLPVFDCQVFVGVIPITAIFDAICKITLSSTGEELPFFAAARDKNHRSQTPVAKGQGFVPFCGGWSYQRVVASPAARARVESARMDKIVNSLMAEVGLGSGHTGGDGRGSAKIARSE